MARRRSKKELEEKIIKFLCGECDDEAEIRDVHRELCASDEFHEFLLATGRVMREIRSCEEDTGEPVSWDDLKSKFNRLAELLEEPARAGEAGKGGAAAAPEKAGRLRTNSAAKPKKGEAALPLVPGDSGSRGK